jgi:molybdenum cofactor guanylyltransferase
MGGGDKGLLDLAGNSMIGHVVRRIRSQVGTLILNANGDPARFASLDLPVAADTIDGFVGPLAGVLAGMRWAAQHVPSARWIATVSSDAPFLPDDLVSRLHTAVADKPTAIAIARSEGELHPVIGLWPIGHADDLELELRAGVRKVLRWTDKHGTIPVDFAKVLVAGQAVDPFFNANTPEELDEARQLLAKSAS